MGFPVHDALGFVQNALRNVLDNIRESMKMGMEVNKTVWDKIQWVTAFIFDKLKWIPVAALIAIVTTLFKHPLEFITRVFCAIIISIFFVFYIILTIPPFSWISFAVWFFFRHVLVLIGFTIVSLTIFGIVAIIFLLLSLANYNGKLTKLALCQTSPFAWFMIPNYQDGNKYDRGFFCNRPCVAGYTPDEMTGSICNRISQAQPSFCPQAEIMRILMKKNRIGERHVYANFIMSPSYFLKKPKDKEEDYIKHFEKMQLFFNKCNRRLGTFNNISLDICSSLDAIKQLKMNSLSDDAINKLKEVCKQGFCNSKSRYIFCGSYVNSTTEKRRDGLLKAIIQLVTFIIMFVFLLTMTYKFLKASTK